MITLIKDREKIYNNNNENLSKDEILRKLNNISYRGENTENRINLLNSYYNNHNMITKTEWINSFCE